MKNILRSLLVIGAVGAVAIGGTVAYFSDSEKSESNTFSAGTIDISVDNMNPWSHQDSYNIEDLKPGESGNINLNVKNEGTNPVRITKRLYDLSGDGGTEVACSTFDSSWTTNMGSSEPECKAERSAINNEIQDEVFYSLDVEVYDENDAKIWWQTIYDGADLTDVYDGTKTVTLGTIPVNGYMLVNQNYELDYNAGNEYQGDGFTFNMEFMGTQLVKDASGMATVVLENKDGSDDWKVLSNDTVKGTLKYKTTDPEFEFEFTGNTNTAGTYSLIYVGASGNYPYGNDMEILGTDTGTSISISGSVDTGSITNGKIWLVPTTDGWDQTNTLFETALINYTKN